MGWVGLGWYFSGWVMFGLGWVPVVVGVVVGSGLGWCAAAVTRGWMEWWWLGRLCSDTTGRAAYAGVRLAHSDLL